MTNTTIQLHNVVRPHTMAMVRDLDDETVFLQLNNEHYFGLDPIGSTFYKALVESKNISDAISKLQGIYDIDDKEIERDMLELVTELSAKDLITIE